MSNYCFVYIRAQDDFKEIDEADTAEKYFSFLSEEPSKLEEYAKSIGNDAVLLFNVNDPKWILFFAQGSGIIAQRTARRRADSVSRTGILLSSGERIGVRAPLSVLSDSNIGDLNKSVQSKYLEESNLRGVGE